jgi:hypothetical protein
MSKMRDPLATYLQDHLAGSVHAIELVEAIRDQHSDQPLGRFAANLLVEIKEDRDVLRALADRVVSGSSTVEDLGAWLGEKVSKLKLGRGGDDPLALFESLEFLALGIHGKRALWRALAVTAHQDPRLQGIDFNRLASRAEKQHANVEGERLEAARNVLPPDGN